MEDPNTLAELFSRDPLTLTREDIDKMIEHYREQRKYFKLSGKVAPPTKKVDLDELGLL